MNIIDRIQIMIVESARGTVYGGGKLGFTTGEKYLIKVCTRIEYSLIAELKKKILRRTLRNISINKRLSILRQNRFL